MLRHGPDRHDHPEAMITIITYLLHVEFADGSVEHYVGSTKTHELRRRLRDHASGIGTKTTAEMYRRGATFYLVHAWIGFDRSVELALLRENKYQQYCPHCPQEHDGERPRVHQMFRLEGAPPMRVASLSF